MKETIKKLCEFWATRVLAENPVSILYDHTEIYRTRANPDIQFINTMTDEKMLEYCKSQFTEEELKEILK